jgi:hypothetical protein
VTSPLVTCTTSPVTGRGSTSGLSIPISPGDRVDIAGPASGMPGGTQGTFSLTVGP